jgi:hypothetical protein
MKSKPTQNKESKVNELTQKLKDGVQQFYSSERWIEFLKVQSKRKSSLIIRYPASILYESHHQ